MFSQIFGAFSGVFQAGQPAAGASARQAPPASDAPPVDPQRQLGAQKKHLVVMVHGLFGSAANWRVIGQFLAAQLDPQATVLYISKANEFNKARRL
jgi:hypothetical protein